MKIKEFFFNCLNRRSFHFLSYTGMMILFIPLIYLLISYINDFISCGFIDDGETIFFIFATFILPTFGLATLIATIIIYIKLLLREDLNPEYRIKNKFLSKNPIYGFFIMIFFLFALYIIIASLFLISSVLIQNITFEVLEQILIPFISYVIILIFITIRV